MTNENPGHGTPPYGRKQFGQGIMTGIIAKLSTAVKRQRDADTFVYGYEIECRAQIILSTIKSPTAVSVVTVLQEKFMDLW